MISKERFREEAQAAYTRWLGDENSTLDCEDYIADALHALYEAEATSAGKTALQVRAEQDLDGAARALRLASIKETARLYASCNSTLDFAFSSAEAFEAEFERRYGGGA